jgi:hypothetical protein
MLLEKMKKATSDIVTVVFSAKIRSWTFLKEEDIQHFEPVCSVGILLLLLLLLLIFFYFGSIFVKDIFLVSPVLVC